MVCQNILLVVSILMYTYFCNHIINKSLLDIDELILNTIFDLYLTIFQLSKVSLFELDRECPLLDMLENHTYSYCILCFQSECLIQIFLIWILTNSPIYLQIKFMRIFCAKILRFNI